MFDRDKGGGKITVMSKNSQKSTQTKFMEWKVYIFQTCVKVCSNNISVQHHDFITPINVEHTTNLKFEIIFNTRKYD